MQITSKKVKLHRSTQTGDDGRFTLDQVLSASDYALKITAGIKYNAYEQADVTLDYGMGDLQAQLEYSPVGGGCMDG